MYSVTGAAACTLPVVYSASAQPGPTSAHGTCVSVPAWPPGSGAGPGCAGAAGCADWAGPVPGVAAVDGSAVMALAAVAPGGAAPPQPASAAVTASADPATAVTRTALMCVLHPRWASECHLDAAVLRRLPQGNASPFGDVSPDGGTDAAPAYWWHTGRFGRICMLLIVMFET